jgi:hypothetical protein
MRSSTARFSSGASMAHSREIETLAGALAQQAGLGINFLFAQMVEQASCMQGRMAAAGFCVNQHLAEDGSP